MAVHFIVTAGAVTALLHVEYMLPTIVNTRAKAKLRKRGRGMYLAGTGKAGSIPISAIKTVQSEIH